MNNFGLTLVNYKEFAGHDGMPGFNADLKYKGKKIAHVYDDAWGGDYRIDVLGKLTLDKKKDVFVASPQRKENQKLLEELTADVGANYEYEESYEGSFRLDKRPSPGVLLEFLISDLVNLEAIKKDSKKGIVVKDKMGHSIHQWNVSLPTMIKKYKNGLEVIQEGYDDLKNKHEILNTEYLQSIGVIL